MVRFTDVVEHQSELESRVTLVRPEAAALPVSDAHRSAHDLCARAVLTGERETVASPARTAGGTGRAPAATDRFLGRGNLNAPAPAQAHSSWRIATRRVLPLVLAVKLYALLLLYVLFVKTDLRHGDKGFFFCRAGQPIAERCEDIQDRFAERLAPYDGQWYLDIAANGYRQLPAAESHRGMHPPGNYAFFPLLPVILRGAHSLVGEWHLTTTLLLSIFLSAVGATLLWVIARDLEVNPYLATALLLAFPTAVFQLVLYTEGIFLCFSAAALLGALGRRAGLAAAAGALAGLARPQGMLLVLPLFVELLLPVLRGREACSKRQLVTRALFVLAPLCGLAIMAAVSAAVADSPLAFLSIQNRWGRSWAPTGALTAIGSAWGYRGPPADLIGLAFGVILLPVIWRRLPLSLALYGTAMLLLPLSTGSLMSLGRFLSMSIPHFLALALVLQRVPGVLRVGAVGALAATQVLLASGLIAWYLVG